MRGSVCVKGERGDEISNTITANTWKGLECNQNKRNKLIITILMTKIFAISTTFLSRQNLL